MRSLCILGSTGSIGVSTLDVVARHTDRYKVAALSANGNAELLFEQCIKHNPSFAVLLDESKVGNLRDRLDSVPRVKTTVLCGTESLQEIASLDEVDTVMAAIVGAAGLLPTLAAAESGKRVLLANKETIS